MTNEEIIDITRGTELWQYYGEEINKLLNLARQDEREKMQGVDCYITASKHYAEIYIGGDKPLSMIWGHFYKSSKEQHCSRLNRHTARLLGVELNQCKKFRIVEVENE